MSGRFIPQWVFEEYPWIKDAWSWVDWAKNVLHGYEGVILFVGLLIVWRGLRYESARLGDRIETLRQLVTAVRDQNETAPPIAATPDAAPESTSTNSQRKAEPPNGREHFEGIRQLWRAARERIEQAIEDIPRSRTRGKYGQLPRYTYREVIIALNRDGLVSNKEMAELLRMNSIFDGLRSRPASATAQQLESVKEAYRLGTKSLPKLPNIEADVVAESPVPSNVAAPQPLPLATAS